MKHIRIELEERKPKTNVWTVINKSYDEVIGKIFWYGPWRQYCFENVGDVILAASCMNDISAFIKKQMATKKKGKGKQ